MKFGHNLAHNQVPEWTTAYIDYKALKKLIKSTSPESTAGNDADLTISFCALDRQLGLVDSFYHRKYSDCSRKLQLLIERYGDVATLKESMDSEDLQDLMGTLLELRGQYSKLQWYGEVNRRGFTKIMKKLDKKIQSSCSQSQHVTSRVGPKPFATDKKVILDAQVIGEWLSALDKLNSSRDDISLQSHPSGLLRHVLSHPGLRVPTAALEAIETALRGDDVSSLSELTDAAVGGAEAPARQYWLLQLLQRAMTLRAFKAIAWLLQRVDSLDDSCDSSKRNCLHRLVLAIGRARILECEKTRESDATATAAVQVTSRYIDIYGSLERDFSKTLHRHDPAVKLLLYILDHLSLQQRSAILTRDDYGRSPLHYTSQYGLVAASQEILKRMHIWGLLDDSSTLSEAWRDMEGYVPLHLAVMSGHFRTTKALLQHGDAKTTTNCRARKSTPDGALLLLAVSRSDHRISQLLVDAGVDVNYCNEQGEGALHIAARSGHVPCTKTLLSVVEINTEMKELNIGWTPLSVACVYGHLPIVEMLLQAGAQASQADNSGWLPKEHAALRGHLDIARRLVLETSCSTSQVPSNTDQQSITQSSLPNVCGFNGTRNAFPRKTTPVRTFGHRYLKDETTILVNLGTTDHRTQRRPVNLDHINMTDAHAAQLATALSIVVTMQDATGEKSIIDLPVHEDISTSPISFTTTDLHKTKLMFDLVPTYAGSTNQVIARAVAMLSSIKQSIGSSRASLQNDLTVPLLAADNLDVIGTIDFNLLVIKPFVHHNMEISKGITQWSSTPTKIIGHRGLGKNMSTKTHLQLGENTIQSFVTAANFGATYVEFDVQLTKDLVPVIYHDFLVAETGADVPVHTLTLEQFLQLKGEARHAVMTDMPHRNGRTQRSYSVGGSNENQFSEMKERMKHTRALKEKGFKANTKGDSIQSPFTTLAEMFHKIPENVGFNIEMKYPTLLETEQHDIDAYAIELNTFVDGVLQVVYDLGHKRNIIFSSFHPDVCLMLSYKQSSIPVLFLTDAGASKVNDVRASSLQEAIRFASKWNLFGIVSAAEPMILCPRLVRVVKEAGLVCVTYGTLNNEVRNGKLQAQEGIDAVIVDSVLKVHRGLTDGEHPSDEGING